MSLFLVSAIILRYIVTSSFFLFLVKAVLSVERKNEKKRDKGRVNETECIRLISLFYFQSVTIFV